ncbi:MAG: NADPH:quinone oxidoreductase family protein [Bacteroidota bacterium]
MKAVLCKAWGPPESLQLEEVPSPKAGKGQVVISVKACGVNFPDTLIIEGKYQTKPELPFSPGGEVAGVVKEVGEGVKHLKEGMPVFCLMGYGGFAEEVVAEASVTFPIPPGMDFINASAISLTYGTSMHALKDRARLKEGETLLVLGAAGGVGLAAIQIAVQMGAKVIAAASTEEKLAFCRENGASETINYRTEDLKARVKELTDGKGVDVVYDPVGGDYAEIGVRSMAWNGRFLVIGFATGEIPAIPLNLALLKGCSLVGVFWGRFAQTTPHKNMANFMQLLQWFQEGKLKPHIYKTYSLQQAAAALNDITDRKVMGKVVLVTDAN